VRHLAGQGSLFLWQRTKQAVRESIAATAQVKTWLLVVLRDPRWLIVPLFGGRQHDGDVGFLLLLERIFLVADEARSALDRHVHGLEKTIRSARPLSYVLTGCILLLFISSKPLPNWKDVWVIFEHLTVFSFFLYLGTNWTMKAMAGDGGLIYILPFVFPFVGLFAGGSGFLQLRLSDGLAWRDLHVQ